MDVDAIINVVKEYFPEWGKPEELCLDAEAIHKLSSVIKLQSDWVKHRSSSLYTDLFLLEEKIRRISPDELADIFLKAWNPIVETEQITIRSLAQAMSYWRSLLPLDERWAKTDFWKREPGTVTREELVKERLIAEKAFSEELETFWEELKEKVGEKGKIRYWDFVGAEAYSETVKRAYMTSFLITYGYATLEIRPLEEEMFIKPFEKPEPLVGKKRVMSVPVSVGVEEWKEWKGSLD